MKFIKNIILIIIIYFSNNILSKFQNNLVIKLNGDECIFLENGKEVENVDIYLFKNYYLINVENSRIYYLNILEGSLCKNISKINLLKEIYENVRNLIIFKMRKQKIINILSMLGISYQNFRIWQKSSTRSSTRGVSRDQSRSATGPNVAACP